MKKNYEEIQKEIEEKEERRIRRKKGKVAVSGKSIFKLQEILKNKSLKKK